MDQAVTPNLDSIDVEEVRRNFAHIDDLVLDPSEVLEPALGNTPMEGHLPALETRPGLVAGPRAGAILSPSCGFTRARTLPTAQPFRVPAGARRGAQIVKLSHRYSS